MRFAHKEIMSFATAHLPTIGLQLQTGTKYNDYNNYYTHTTAEFYKTGYCLECGSPFMSMNSKNKYKDGIKFCCAACGVRYTRRKIKEANIQLAYNRVDAEEFKIYFKKYSNFVYSEIFKQDSELHEDLIDWWNETAIRHLYNNKKFEKIHHRKPNIFSYLRTAVMYSVMNVKRKREHEVFYDECNIKTQQAILGTCNYED